MTDSNFVADAALLATVVTPLFGLVGWMVRTLMTKFTEALQKNTEVLQTLVNKVEKLSSV